MNSSDIVLGGIYPSLKYGNVEVMEIVSWHKVRIKFLETGSVIWTSKGNILTKKLKDKFYPSIAGIGFIGLGSYGTKHATIYRRWKTMITRCYDKENDKYRAYGAKGVRVATEWHNFQNYATWFITYMMDHYPDLDPLKDNNLHVDKDINSGTNKIYSPETCMIIPASLNISLASKGKGKIYTFQNLDGRIEKDISVPEFVKKYSLDFSNVYKMINGKYSHANGWFQQRIAVKEIH